jgi:hypothetical protein
MSSLCSSTYSTETKIANCKNPVINGAYRSNSNVQCLLIVVAIAATRCYSSQQCIEACQLYCGCNVGFVLLMSILKVTAHHILRCSSGSALVLLSSVLYCVYVLMIYYVACSVTVCHGSTAECNFAVKRRNHHGRKTASANLCGTDSCYCYCLLRLFTTGLISAVYRQLLVVAAAAV